MQDADLFAFMQIFRELLKVFPKRAGEDEIDPLARSYFRALQRFTVPQIQAGADAWTQRGKFFPKPSEWREAIPRTATDFEALTEFTPVDAAEYLDAERRRWEGEPCGCRQCVSAGVSHRFLRYVPEQDDRGMDARGLIGQRAVTRGHWAHGDELARWYAAKDWFWADYKAQIVRMLMPKAKAIERIDTVEELEAAV